MSVHSQTTRTAHLRVDCDGQGQSFRCETIASDGMFKKYYASRRCLVPVDGYFEWRKLDASGKKKQPYASP
jgi:putative SOS response-associated peptidase YedK